MQKSRKNAHLNFTIGTNEFCDYKRLALSIGMFTRGEVGAGVIFIALGYSLGGPALVISVLTLVLNLVLTGIFVVWVKKLALRTYAPEEFDAVSTIR